MRSARSESLENTRRKIHEGMKKRLTISKDLFIISNNTIINEESLTEVNARNQSRIRKICLKGEKIMISVYTTTTMTTTMPTMETMCTTATMTTNFKQLQ